MPVLFGSVLPPTRFNCCSLITPSTAIFPQEQIERIQPLLFNCSRVSILLMSSCFMILPSGNSLGVEKTKKLNIRRGCKSFKTLVAEHLERKLNLMKVLKVEVCTSGCRLGKSSKLCCAWRSNNSRHNSRLADKGRFITLTV